MNPLDLQVQALAVIHVFFRTFRREETLLQGMDLMMIDNEKGSSRFHDCR